MTARRILLADDDRLILKTMAECLRRQGYEIVEASDGEEAVQAGLTRSPDLAILDIRMPKFSGIEVARQLRERGEIPVLFLSAYGDEEVVRAAVAEGALGYIVKPVDVGQLVPAIETALGRAADLRELREQEVRLQLALTGSRYSGMAVGLLMERYRLSEKQAFEALRLHARSQRRKLEDIAAGLVQASDALNLPPNVLQRVTEGTSPK